jgi:four helix bundle protein
MKDYKKFNVFQKARHFNLEIYITPKIFPESEQFGIGSQIRRASVSIATNIAECCRLRT